MCLGVSWDRTGGPISGPPRVVRQPRWSGAGPVRGPKSGEDGSGEEAKGRTTARARRPLVWSPGFSRRDVGNSEPANCHVVRVRMVCRLKAELQTAAASVRSAAHRRWFGVPALAGETWEAVSLANGHGGRVRMVCRLKAELQTAAASVRSAAHRRWFGVPALAGGTLGCSEPGKRSRRAGSDGLPPKGGTPNFRRRREETGPPPLVWSPGFSRRNVGSSEPGKRKRRASLDGLPPEGGPPNRRYAAVELREAWVFRRSAHGSRQRRHPRVSGDHRSLTATSRLRQSGDQSPHSKFRSVTARAGRAGSGDLPPGSAGSNCHSSWLAGRDFRGGPSW